VTVALLPDSTLAVKTADGREIARGPYIRVGRAPTIGERRTYGNLKLAYWEPPILTKPAGVTVMESRDGGNLVLTVRAQYALPGDRSRMVSSSTVLTIRPGGIIDLASELTPSGEGALMEFGTAWEFPVADAVSWLGGGPFPAYPYKDTLDEHGVWRMSSDDPFFAGNRRNVEMARIGGASNGVGILTAPSDIGWERGSGGIVMSMNLHVAGLGTKFHPPRLMWRTGDIGTVQGTMRWVIAGKNDSGLFGEVFGN
jgi:beta-galactosidase